MNFWDHYFNLINPLKNYKKTERNYKNLKIVHCVDMLKSARERFGNNQTHLGDNKSRTRSIRIVIELQQQQPPSSSLLRVVRFLAFRCEVRKTDRDGAVS